MSGYHRTVTPETFEVQAYGTPALSHVDSGTKSVKPQGFTGFVTEPLVEFFHRTLKPSGFSALSMGSSRSPFNPYAWQTLHVGPPMPTIPEGFNAELFGATWISLRVRDVFIPGSDFFLCEYDIDAFEQRMRVEEDADPAARGAQHCRTRLQRLRQQHLRQRQQLGPIHPPGRQHGQLS